MTLWLEAKPLVLASKSAIRRTMLEAAGIPLEVRPADIDERMVETAAAPSSPAAVATLLAREKALAVSRYLPQRLILGVDQTLDLAGRTLSKPPDRDAARTQLQALAGRRHELHSAVAIVADGRVLFQFTDTARLSMRVFSGEFLDAYLAAAGEAVTASVGAYQLEGLGVQLFERIEGDYFTILGLPLLAVLDFLRGRGSLMS
jgi:septum formation protein